MFPPEKLRQIQLLRLHQIFGALSVLEATV
jgi:hypothetical protein